MLIFNIYLVLILTLLQNLFIAINFQTFHFKSTHHNPRILSFLCRIAETYLNKFNSQLKRDYTEINFHFIHEKFTTSTTMQLLTFSLTQLRFSIHNKNQLLQLDWRVKRDNKGTITIFNYSLTSF